MTEAFRVNLQGQTVAHLFARGDYTWLEWQEDYWEDPDRPVLGLRFENDPDKQVSSALRLPPWFSNLLPEGRLREWMARDASIWRTLLRFATSTRSASTRVRSRQRPPSSSVAKIWTPTWSLYGDYFSVLSSATVTCI